MQSKRFLIVCGNMLATKRERRLGICKQIDKQRLMFFRLQTQDADVTGEVGVALALGVPLIAGVTPRRERLIVKFLPEQLESVFLFFQRVVDDVC